MKYFTPQLYQQFNSRDEAEAERANEAWEQAILDYKRYLESIHDRMPSQVLALSELCLHDAAILSRTEVIQGAPPVFFHDFPYPFPMVNWSAVAIVTVRLSGEILSLFYSLWDRIRTHEAPADWPFSKEREHWLYDEVHALDGRRESLAWLHRILLSTGITLEIPFLSVLIHRFPLPALTEGRAKQSA